MIEENTVADLTCLEICAGAGGQSLGLELAGFAHQAAVEIDEDACETLRLNRDWDVLQMDVHKLKGEKYEGVDLLAGGVPCPPFSIAGKRLGADDDRDLFPQALRLVKEANPRAVMLENVKGLGTVKFEDYRLDIKTQLEAMDYKVDWQLLNSCEFGVPQLRPRFILVALKQDLPDFEWPCAVGSPPSVGKALERLMGADGWEYAKEWAAAAKSIGPTLVGGSRKHGGPDLGPSRARADWARLGVDGRSLADQPPQKGDPLADPMPKLTLEMTARIQGFPADWKFYGRKTAAYRQIGNAFPPPVAEAVGKQIKAAIMKADGLSDTQPLLHAVG
jgi:DNA (cytosine-5)-methyltransferase 1